MKVVQDDMSVGQSYERVSWSSKKYCEIWSKMHVFPVKIPFCVKYMRVWEKVIGGKCLLWDRVQHSKLLQKAPYHVNCSCLYVAWVTALAAKGEVYRKVNTILIRFCFVIFQYLFNLVILNKLLWDTVVFSNTLWLLLGLECDTTKIIRVIYITPNAIFELILFTFRLGCLWL